jgi:8-oxo-dGTP pyrophosphatase MutT (NUDIX family)
VVACIRETEEECGLTPEDYTIKTTWTVKLKDVTIVYYCSTLNDKVSLKNVILDSKEHVCYQWCCTKQWMQMDLILDLKAHLTEAMV